MKKIWIPGNRVWKITSFRMILGIPVSLPQIERVSGSANAVVDLVTRAFGLPTTASSYLRRENKITLQEGVESFFVKFEDDGTPSLVLPR